MSEWEGEERRKKLHLEPHISYGHIITTVGLIISGISAWVHLSSMIAVHESEIAALKITDSSMTTTIKENQKIIQDQLNRLEDKLDRIKEKA